MTEPLEFLKFGDSQVGCGKDASMTIKNPFRKKPEKKTEARPASSYRAPAAPRRDDSAQNITLYTAVTETSPATDCSPSPSTSCDSGSSSSSSSYDSGSSYSSSSYDSGSSSCDSGGGF